MKPATTFTALSTPMLDSKGVMTYTWVQWFIDVQNRVQNALNAQGQFDGNISSNATVGNRSESLSTDIQNIDSNGVITANGIDFTRAYLNKNTDNIADGTGSPLAGGKTAYAAMVASAPTAGELLGFDGTEWKPQQKAHTLGKVAHEWIDSYSEITGDFTQSQPNFTDLAGTLSPSQIPTPTPTTLGGVKSAGPAAHEWVNAIDNTGTPQLSQPSAADLSNGTTGSGSVVLATSPTFVTNATSPNFTISARNNGLVGPNPNQGLIDDNAPGAGGWNFSISTSSTFGWRFWKGVPGVTQLAQIDGSGNFTAVTKSFDIPYPGDPTKRLLHSCLEGPEYGVYYRGEAQLSNGVAIIALPEYFEALTIPSNRTIHLTPMFEGGEAISHLAYSAVVDGRFIVRATDSNNPSQKFSWILYAVRSDQALLQAIKENDGS